MEHASAAVEQSDAQSKASVVAAGDENPKGGRGEATRGECGSERETTVKRQIS